MTIKNRGAITLGVGAIFLSGYTLLAAAIWLLLGEIGLFAFVGITLIIFAIICLIGIAAQSPSP